MDFILCWNHVRPDTPVSWSDISFKIPGLFFKLSAMLPDDDLELRTYAGIALLLWELLCSGLYPSPSRASHSRPLCGVRQDCLAPSPLFGKYLTGLPHWKLGKGLTEASVIISQFNCPFLSHSSSLLLMAFVPENNSPKPPLSTSLIQRILPGESSQSHSTKGGPWNRLSWR